MYFCTRNIELKENEKDNIITNAEGNCISNETGTVNVTMGDDCTWTLTADTYITSLKGETSRIKSNGHRLFVNGKQIKVD